MTDEARLDQVAGQRGWRLRWRAAAAPGAPSLVLTELEIAGVTKGVPVWVIHSADVDGRASIARTVLAALPEGGALSTGSRRTARP